MPLQEPHSRPNFYSEVKAVLEVEVLQEQDVSKGHSEIVSRYQFPAVLISYVDDTSSTETDDKLVNDNNTHYVSEHAGESANTDSGSHSEQGSDHSLPCNGSGSKSLITVRDNDENSRLGLKRQDNGPIQATTTSQGPSTAANTDTAEVAAGLAGLKIKDEGDDADALTNDSSEPRNNGGDCGGDLSIPKIPGSWVDEDVPDAATLGDDRCILM
jgi:hypothetical protein